MTKRGPIKVILGSLALLGFLSVTFFWSAGTHQGDKHDCIAAAVQNQVCPNAATPEAAAFHLNTLQSLVSNILQTWQHYSVFLAFAFVALVGLAGLLDNISPQLMGRSNDTRVPAPPKGYGRWLSLLEHSPVLIPGRV